MKPISFDHYLFMMENGVPYDGLIDVDGIMLRSVCDTVPVPPEHHYIGNPPRFADYGQDTVSLITKSTLCYFPQDNPINTSELVNEITAHAVKYNNVDGTVSVNFGNSNIQTFPSQNTEIRVSVSDNDYFLGAMVPTLTISVQDNTRNSYYENKILLDDLPVAYGQNFKWLKTTKNVISIIGFTASSLELGAGNSTYRLYRQSGTKFSPKLYRRSPNSTKKPYTGGGRGNIKVYKAAKTLRAAGTVLFFVGAAFDIADYNNGTQTLEKTMLNIGVGAGCLLIGGVPGLLIGIAYFGLNALLSSDESDSDSVGEPYHIKPFDPYQSVAPYCPADKTRVAIPMVVPELMPNLDGLNISPMDNTKFQRLLLDE